MKKIDILLLCLALAGLSSHAEVDSPKTGKVRAGLAAKAPAEAPVVLPATNITETGFTANFEPLAGAEGYSVSVFSRFDVPESGEWEVLAENFSLVELGSVVEPYWVDEYFIDLSSEEWDLVWTPNWGVSGYASFAGGVVGGVIYSPYMDLTNNGGKYKVVIGVQGYVGQEYEVRSVGSTEEKRTAKLTCTGRNELTFEFENGARDTYLVFVDNGFPDAENPDDYLGAYAYLDDVSVRQDLNAGDQVLQLVAINESIEAPLTSADFDPLRFAYDEKTFYYDVVAAFRYYPDPDDPYNYEQWYSPYSDLQEVHLIQTSAVELELAGSEAAVEVYSVSGQYVGDSTDGLRNGIYIVRRGGRCEKIFVTN